MRDMGRGALEVNDTDELMSGNCPSLLQAVNVSWVEPFKNVLIEFWSFFFLFDTLTP